MTDPDLVAKKLAFIETCVRELRGLGQADRIETDVREQRFVAHTTRIGTQAAMDIASHIVSDDRLGDPGTNREIFDLLTKGQWLGPEQVQIMHATVGFRNIVVNGYEILDLTILRTSTRTPWMI